MCYDISTLTFKAKKYASYYGVSTNSIDEITRKGPPIYHTSGFSHPDLPVIINTEPHQVKLFQWGLIPKWVKDASSATKMSNNTLNARGETIFEKNSFRSSAKNKRCLIIADGFYEHHHFNGHAYPFYISLKNGEPLSFAGLWEEWQGLYTCSIVTTAANPIMAKIHNNPKAIENQRMPAILPKGLERAWLQSVNDPLDQKHIEELIQPFDESQMQWHTVQKLRGKNYLGNIPETRGQFIYEELVF
ncbi:SOS response-associated peptidase [Fulvivirga maritima]|uniref:SOS response-associated peptidase n=1 Tax=Fulvivirga maritima TaxID=2904247 RepID=UPI001F377E1D|nr:SOS response-associated peptidase [Fulvivirga maritima]UII25754.1 SOS response-associated peptidase [Fulvivirga maritima]